MSVNTLLKLAAVVALCLPVGVARAQTGYDVVAGPGCGSGYADGDCGGCGWLHCNRPATYGYAASLWDGYCQTPNCYSSGWQLPAWGCGAGRAAFGDCGSCGACGFGSQFGYPCPTSCDQRCCDSQTCGTGWKLFTARGFGKLAPRGRALGLASCCQNGWSYLASCGQTRCGSGGLARFTQHARCWFHSGLAGGGFGIGGCFGYPGQSCCSSCGGVGIAGGWGFGSGSARRAHGLSLYDCGHQESEEGR